MFESLIPKPILQRYVSLLTEHRRIILSGPSGTGKTYLANRLSEYVVLREGRELTDGVIATFNVDHKSSKVRRSSCDCCTLGSLNAADTTTPSLFKLHSRKPGEELRMGLIDRNALSQTLPSRSFI